jgi:hypothetical protein
MMAEGHREAARSVIDGGEHDATIGSAGPPLARFHGRHSIWDALPQQQSPASPNPHPGLHQTPGSLATKTRQLSAPHRRGFLSPPTEKRRTLSRKI